MATLADLRAIVGDADAREGAASDAVAGIPAAHVARPADAEQVAALLRLADRAGWAVAPRGGGTKLGWGAPPRRVDLLLDLGRLDRILEHAAGDLVVRAEAGVRYDRLQAALEGDAQMLALDSPYPSATLGGMVAANVSGARRLRYGTVRDLLIGITVVLADGTVAKAGGKVVKNVAGYDLAKLFTGSLGTLGVIVETIFRLHPRPAARRAVSVSLASPRDAGQAVQSLFRSTLEPSAVELRWSGGAGRLHLLFEGIEPGAAAQAETARSLLGELGETAMEDGAAAPRDEADAAMRLKVAHPPAALEAVLVAAEEEAHRAGAAISVEGHAASGVLYLSLDGEPAALAGLPAALRTRVAEGSVVALRVPPEVRGEVDVWGPVGDALPLMRRVKEQFDPAGRMNPGRFVGGI